MIGEAGEIESPDNVTERVTQRVIQPGLGDVLFARALKELHINLRFRLRPSTPAELSHDMAVRRFGMLVEAFDGRRYACAGCGKAVPFSQSDLRLCAETDGTPLSVAEKTEIRHNSCKP